MFGFPLGRVLVAGKDDVAVALFVVSPVNQIEEQSGILLIKFTVTYFINNQAGGTNQAVQNRSLLACPAGGGKLVP